MPRMNRFAALLRGVNVGGHRKLPMTALRALLEKLGATEVSTYLQSGNAVFSHPQADAEALATQIENAIAKAHAFDVPVMLRTARELERVVARNPFPEVAASPKLLHVAFLSAPVEKKALAALDPERFLPDRFEVDGAHLYLWYPRGAGQTKLTGDIIERQTGARATARNWNTVLALQALLAEG
jgi:uncharacterized protein (DUF1697 family)